jgi:CheY-like chemotaxis protein
MSVDLCPGGVEAIKAVEAVRYDIVFMDHMMPEMNGIEATKQLRELGYEAPIVALTANAVVGQADVFLNNGFDDVISKPIDIRQLNTILIKFIRSKQPAEVIEAARKQNQNTVENDDDSDNYKVLVESFARDAVKAVAELEKLDIETDLEKFTTIVHGMKSALWTIGERSLYELSKALEQAGHDNNTDFIEQSAPELLKGLQSMLNRFETRHSDEEDDVEELKKKLLLIIEACEDYDRKSALALIAEIESASAKTRDFLARISEYITHSDFEEAEEAINAYIAKLGET